jgi:hypothetical protein
MQPQFTHRGQSYRDFHACKSQFTLAKFVAKMPATVTMAALSLATLGRMTQIRLLLFIFVLPKETKVSAANVIVAALFFVANFAY